MDLDYLKVEHSVGLQGEVSLSGAKNAILVTIASLLLTNGISVIRNVPYSMDVLGMLELLQHLGAHVFFDKINHVLTVDTTTVFRWSVPATIMSKMRTSILVMGPLLARFGIVMLEGKPGGDAIGARPIDYHIKNFERMGVTVETNNNFLCAMLKKSYAARLVLEYPSVGATENILMLATRIPGITKIINAACGEPEVRDLISALTKMGAKITIQAPSTIIVEGVEQLLPIDHSVMFDRLEAGSLLLATAASGGQLSLPDASIDMLDMIVLKLEEMGHTIIVGAQDKGITFKATQKPKAVSFKTGPFPAFPTDLQAPMMALQCFASGISVVEETVFENRFLHVPELKKMGACIEIYHNKATITGVDYLKGSSVVASDIRASMALVIAGLAAHGTTIISGVYHWKRGYDAMEKKLALLGARIQLCEISEDIVTQDDARERKSLQQ